MKLHGKTALITGGAKGIGYATALRLVDAGCSLMVWDIDEAALEEAQAEITARAAPQAGNPERANVPKPFCMRVHPANHLEGLHLRKARNLQE